ncbi:MAG TPA: AAA family ATPase [Thermoleophilia bacterium]|nr:AAA family ATPase [Thermoleophilia bacterium]
MTASCPACRAPLPEAARFCPACGTRLAAGGPEATERKTVTTLFADLVGFTALGERHDPEDIDAGLRGFYALARTIVERFGGAVEKFIGDAVVGLFGVPAAHEDDAERAVRAALELVAHLHELPQVGGEPLQVRCAVNTGPALVRLDARPETGEGVLVGDAVNTCARLLAEAPPMGVVAGELTQRLSARAIAYEELLAIAAKGKSAPVRRWLARGAIARRGADATRRDEIEMVGREVELAVLSGLIDRAIAARSPQYALVTGEAGIGKSRLVRELFRLLDTKRDLLCNWRQGGCPPYGSALAYWALREVVGAHAGVVPGDSPEAVDQRLRNAVSALDSGEWLVARLRPLMGLAAPEAAREENLAAWTQFFESIARSRPAVIVLEDLQWASESTLDFLRYFVVHAADVRLLLVCTARPEFLEAHPDLFAEPKAVTHVVLKALGADESSRLASALLRRGDTADLAAEVAAGCGGNPLFAEELSRFLREREATGRKVAGAGSPENRKAATAPSSILTLIAARLDALPPNERRLLGDAAVVGAVFWPLALAAVGQHDPADVDAQLRQLEQREFVRRRAHSTMGEETELGFWHALVRDVAYERLPRASRATRHFRLARWLEDQTRDSDDSAEIIAHHYKTGLELADASGLSELVTQNLTPAQGAFMRAGDRALRLDVAAAERYYELAMDIEDGDFAPPDLLLKRGEALRAVGRGQDAACLQRQAALRLEAVGDDRRRAYALSRLARSISWLHPEESRRVAEQAVDLLDGTPSDESIAVLETWATHRLWQGDLSGVIDATEKILGMSRQLERPSPPRALSLHGYARFISGETAGLDEMVQAIDIAEQVSAAAADLFGLREVYARCVCVERDPAQALESVRRWITEAEQRKDATSAVDFGVYAARYLLMCGQWDETLAVVGGLLEKGRQREFRLTEAELCATSVAAHLGRGTPEAAATDIVRLEALFSEIRSDWPPFGTIVLAVAALISRRARLAADLLGQLGTNNFASEPIDILYWPLAVRTALAARHASLAGQLATVAFQWPTCPARVTHTVSGLLAEHAGRPEAAARHYEAAADAWRLGRSPHEEGLALLGLGRCLLALRRQSDADATLTKARDLFAGIGSRSELAEVDDVIQSASP